MKERCKAFLQTLWQEEWLEKWNVLVTGLFLIGWIQFLSDYWIWHSESATIVKWTIGIVIAVSLFHKVPKPLRWVIQLAGILLLTYRVLGEAPFIVRVHNLQELGSLLEDNGDRIYPYIWFGLGAWAAFHYFIWWVASKLRVVLLTIGSVIAFAAIDSYTKYDLWQEVAAFIFTGLVLLVINHFRHLKRRNPDSYAELMEYPVSIFGSVAAVIALMMMAGTIVPDIRPILEDPYTAWIEKDGKGTKPGPGDGTTPLGNNISSPDLLSSSGYGRDDSHLGGGFNYDYSSVMTVNTTHRAYWRGDTKSVYTGRGWLPSDKDLEPLTADGETALKAEAGNLSKRETVEVKQTFRMADGSSYDALFGAYDVENLVIPSEEGIESFQELQYAPSDQSLVWGNQRSELYPSIYVVTSQVPVIREERLRQVTNEKISLPNRSEYLRLPKGLPKRVANMAESVTKEADNSYDKAKMLEEYLSTTYPYSSRPDISKRKSKDFVDGFLFEIKEGYCDYFSSSMAVMARTLGIPSRWVKGFSSGSLPIDEYRSDFLAMRGFLADPNGAGEYTVRNSDAHSWVELYFEGYGWIPFEPTSGFTMPKVTPADAPAPIEELGLEEGGFELDGAQSKNWVTSAVWGGFVVLLAAAMLLAARFRVFRRLRILTGLAKPDLPRHKVIAEFNKLLRHAKRRGLMRADYETAREAVTRWTIQNKWLQRDMEAALTLFEKAKYSSSEVTEEDVKAISFKVSKIKEEL